LCLQNSHSTTWARPPVQFTLVFGHGVLRTVCLGWSQLWSSWSQPPK
jgi:hypothetical protein